MLLQTLLYGGILINAILPNSSVAPGTFSSSTLANMFFGEGVCFRANQSACYQPGSQYYQVPSGGGDLYYMS